MCSHATILSELEHAHKVLRHSVQKIKKSKEHVSLKKKNSQLTDMRRGGVRVQARLPANFVSIPPSKKNPIVLGLLGGGREMPL